MGEKCPINLAYNCDFHGNCRVLLHAANLRHGTDGFTSPPKEGMLRIFSPQKNPTASARFEPRELGYQRPSMLTTRPPMLLNILGYIRIHQSAKRWQCCLLFTKPTSEQHVHHGHPKISSSLSCSPCAQTEE
jgi:hypothetical protein